ncbi:MAG: Sensory transduction histidine kinase, partial [Paenibacillus sp.]|nr:Sensory transduction histidine kinase [Paenibacillus sp.]
DYYEQHGGSWSGLQQSPVTRDGLPVKPGASVLLVSPKQAELYRVGEASYAAITQFGIRTPLKQNGQMIALLYYHDAEVAGLSIIQRGISSSVSVLLLAGCLLFVSLSLFVAYWLSKRLTKPIRQLIPAIERLGQGQLGTEAPVIGEDEVATMARTFNAMSRQLLQAEEVRRNLVADVAHELRTPITILRGKLDLLQQEGQPVAPETLLPLQDELIRLTRLIDDLHQLTLAEAKKLPLELADADIVALLQRVVDWAGEEADMKRIGLTLTSATANRALRVDAHRMTQVAINLIMNAVRYTPEGGHVEVRVEDAADGRLRITVADNGPGIAAQHLPYVFNRFYRADEARSRNSGGMGLGLAIAKEFVVAHSGTIEVKSAQGAGTAFIVTLPRQ